MITNLASKVQRLRQQHNRAMGQLLVQIDRESFLREFDDDELARLYKEIKHELARRGMIG